jgi:hypothetical protein
LTLSIFSYNFGKPFKRLRFENTFSANPDLQGLTKKCLLLRYLTLSFFRLILAIVISLRGVQLHTTVGG